MYRFVFGLWIVMVLGTMTTTTWADEENIKIDKLPKAVAAAVKKRFPTATIRDAAKEMDIARDGVVIFRDPATSAINVLYRRPNGELTLVETEG